jgi:hypothetical protein
MRIFHLLVLSLCLLPLPVAAGYFEDVSDEHPYAESIELLRKREIVEGFFRVGERRVFWPEASVTRAEFLKMTILALFPQTYIDGCLTDESVLSRYGLGLPFIDVPRDAWYEPYVCVARFHGLISGYGDGTFRPDNAISLPEGAKILSIGFDLAGEEVPDLDTLGQEWYRPYLFYLEKARALPPTAQGYYHLLTRAEVAEMIARLIQQPSYETPALKVSLDQYAVANPVQWKEYKNLDLGFTLAYPDSWPVPNAVLKGSFDRNTLPALPSLWKIWLGPERTCWGWNSCVERDFSLTGYSLHLFERALKDLEDSQRIYLLSDETVGATRTILYADAVNCPNRSALIVTPRAFVRFSLHCGSTLHDPLTAFMRMLAHLKIEERG